ncbi:hypothetical protein CPB86DRAFT_125324 [Serendipita vermifera]|nr:hypothetical protein CPB86DRAFT_125324 [Serendipita vermifera]
MTTPPKAQSTHSKLSSMKYYHPSYTTSGTEPTVSGYMTMPEDTGRGNKWILATTTRHLEILRAIEGLEEKVMRPRGGLVFEADPRTQKIPWISRTKEGMRPQVLYRLNSGGRDVVLKVEFDTVTSVSIHVPLDSWLIGTCNSEEVRAALQRAYCKDHSSF